MADFCVPSGDVSFDGNFDDLTNTFATFNNDVLNYFTANHHDNSEVDQVKTKIHESNNSWGKSKENLPRDTTSDNSGIKEEAKKIFGQIKIGNEEKPTKQDKKPSKGEVVALPDDQSPAQQSKPTHTQALVFTVIATSILLGVVGLVKFLAKGSGNE